MATKPKVSLEQQLDSFRRWKAGITKHLAGKTLTLSGRTVPAADLVGQVDAVMAAQAATNAQRALWLQRIATRDRMIAALASLVRSLTRYVQGMFGPSSKQLLDFGLVPARRSYKSAKTKLGAAEKSKATRVARHTAGKRQKQKIRGKAA